ncbi:zinc finger protein [Macleaya cordata]|uniref:Zinc finger protein n=1 Tax=Macleaya cordata TaxID=56857 RepID=A0A200PSD0_MACCD|nr:zinc finger protein [Macleaya cordata]
MPDNWKVKINAVNASSDNLEEAMWRLKIQTQDKQNGIAAHSSLYPDRPGEPDCIYYLRTGLCGYGSNCRFNHPSYPGQDAHYRGELPERAGQPDCQYFLKTGTCRFGATCKYNHPRDKHDAGQVPLNMLGLPIRQEEKSCPYYMRTGACKFGFACKFHHPQPAALGSLSPATGNPAYGSTGSSVAPPSSGLPYVGGLPAWSLPRTPYLSGPRMQGPQAYMPVVLSSSQGIIPAQQGWNTYPGTANPVSSSFVYTPKHQDELGSSGQVHMLQTSAPQFPERPDQPECQYYMKTGTCKFGPTCKFHHPKERLAPLATSALGPFGLPLRPGQDVCSFYNLYGICKFGSTCKFDHPLTGFYNYNLSMPTLSIPDPPNFSYQKNSPKACSSENSPSKSSRSPDQNGKPEVTTTKHQNLDMKASEDPSKQAVSSVNTSQTPPESPQDKSQ